MTPSTVYYVNYIDPATGFSKREEFDRHRDMETRIQELKGQGVRHIVKGHFKRE